MKKHLNILFKAGTYTLGVCLLLLSYSCKKTEKTPNLQLEELYKNNLKKVYTFLDLINEEDDVEKKKACYVSARKYFKQSESLLSYLDKSNFKSLNAPNLLQIEEDVVTDIKINSPFGFQVIEELLYSDSIDTLALKSTVEKTSLRIKFVEFNTKLTLKEYHILWLLKDEIVRIATTGLSNFDSPMLGQSLVESKEAYVGVKDILALYQHHFKNEELYNRWVKEIKVAQQELASGSSDTFDRYAFLQNHTHKQLELWNETVNDWEIEFPFELALANNFTSLFDGKMFHLDFFSDYKSDTSYLDAKVDLGKTLFNDTRLSAKGTMSCASCHDKTKAFTDGKVTFSKRQQRNSPTLTYAGLQKAFFMDNRAGSLEGQIVGVVTNHDEFDTDLKHIVNVVSKDEVYATAFDSLYKKGASDINIRHAIASYVRSLNKFNSKFDNNINKKEKTITPSEKRGFNLFMGKAACATCHFPPVFNGTVPPNFSDTELEILGVPETKEWNNATLSKDLGRYELFKTEERKGAFKTPTLRNIAVTAPYMHNGVYNSLEEVLKFYNIGGGQGIGIELEHQTLPFDSLDLSEQEIQDIIAFMKTLTDTAVK